MSANYGAPPPPPPSMPGGAIPGRRLPTQMPPEAPACVQNAMMTKDKKPFTYTPGGIDLSQIKSPRMARRIERNANSEGVSNQPRPSPLAQPNVQPPTPPVMPATAMGMPVQVFPGGGVPRAPQPPPPPPPQQKLLNGNKAPSPNRGKSPQNFEPPPLGCRPEIKIPPNPMASLRPVPKPKPKDDFWVEEYRKERSKSPMVQESGGTSSESAPVHESAPASSSSPPPSMSPINPTASPVVVQQSHVERPVVETPRPAPPQTPQRAPESPKAEAPMIYKKPEISEKPAFLAHQQRMVNPQRSPSPVPKVNQQPHLQQQPQQSAQSRHQSRWNTPSSGNGQETQPLTVFNNVSSAAAPPTPRPAVATNGQSNNHQNVYPVQQQVKPQPPPPQQQSKPSQLGSLYIPPVAPQDLYSNNGTTINNNNNNTKPTLVNPQTPNWMQRPQATQEVPEWVNRDNGDSNGVQFGQKIPAQQHYQEAVKQQQQQPPRVVYQQQPQVQQQQQRPAQTVQYKTNSTTTTEQTTTHRERIIPIQLEETPSPSKCPTSPGFGPQPYYNMGQQQYSSVQSPGGTVYHQTNSPSITPTIYHNPNQFVDQGYSNFGMDPFNNARGPIAQQPTILQRTFIWPNNPTGDPNPKGSARWGC